MPDNKILIMIGGMAFLLPAAPFLALAGIELIVVGCIIYSVIKSFDEQNIYLNFPRRPSKLTVKNNRQCRSWAVIFLRFQRKYAQKQTIASENDVKVCF